jgi:putative membrane protein
MRLETLAVVLGGALLAIVWFGPWADISHQSFAAHMAGHMAVVAVAAPLVAIGIAGRRLDPVCHLPGLFVAIPASLVELVAVWTWHTPSLHLAARHETWMFVAEQASFVGSGLLLWLSVLGGDNVRRLDRAASGIVALALTLGHMTLLGALLALSPRPLYHEGMNAMSALLDQQLGGVIMLAIGAVSYLAGGVYLAGTLLRLRPRSEQC